METMMLDVKELQNVLGVGRETAYSLMRNKSFPAVRIGRRYLVEKDALNAWLKRYQGRQFLL